MAILREEFWNKKELDPKYTSIIVEGYYEIIKELIISLMYLKGYKSENHECLISYLKNTSYQVLLI